MKITFTDALSCGYCASGQRKFARRHGFNWFDYVENGIDEEVLINTGDAMALTIVEHVKNGIKKGS